MNRAMRKFYNRFCIHLFCCCLLIVTACQHMPAQANLFKPVPVDTVDGANYAADTLVFDIDSSNLKDFFVKFNNVVKSGQGNISILHIGGSHVQAGTFSHRIRRNILLSCPDMITSRGIIFPYSAAPKCNNPSDYRVKKNGSYTLIRSVFLPHSKPLGASGIAVYTADSAATITIKMNDKDLNFATNRLTLIGYPEDTACILPTLIVAGKEYEPVEYSKVTRRYIYQIPDTRDSFLIKLNTTGKNGTFVVTGILLENMNKPGITFHSIGVNGARVDSYLNCINFDEDLELITPDLVIFGIGINDAMGDAFDTVAFERKYLELAAKFRAINPDCAFIFLTNNDSFNKSGKKYAVNKNGELARRAFYRIAQKTNGAVWDQFAIMGGLTSMDKWRIAGYAQTDRVHFTTQGYNLLGDLFFNAFIDAKNKCLK